jgi:hypothetical protein
MQILAPRLVSICKIVLAVLGKINEGGSGLGVMTFTVPEDV